MSKTYTIKGLAIKWGKEEQEIERYLQQDMLRCSINLNGKFRVSGAGIFQDLKSSGFTASVRNELIGVQSEDSRHNEFLIENYYIFPFGSNAPFYPRDLDLKRFGDGADYKYQGIETTTKDQLFITQEEVDRFEAERDEAAAPGIDTTKDTETNTGRKEITTTTDTPGKKGELQYAVEKYLDRNTDGTWEGFKAFIDEKLNLSEQEVLFRKIKYRDFFQKTDKNGILLHDPKHGKTPADANFNRYTVADIKAVIRKEKAKRQQK